MIIIKDFQLWFQKYEVEGAGVRPDGRKITHVQIDVVLSLFNVETVNNYPLMVHLKALCQAYLRNKLGEVGPKEWWVVQSEYDPDEDVTREIKWLVTVSLKRQDKVPRMHVMVAPEGALEGKGCCLDWYDVSMLDQALGKFINAMRPMDMAVLELDEKSD